MPQALPFPADPIDKPVDAVSSDTTSLQHPLGYSAINSLKGGQSVALHLWT